LLFCRLLRRDLGELVFVMEHNLNCSMKTFHELWNHSFARGLAGRLRRCEGAKGQDLDKYISCRLKSARRQECLGRKEAKSLDF
jgi:hypothetical protein